MKALFDTNVVLDILLQRDNFFKDSFSSLVISDFNKYKPCITSNSISDIYYLSSKLIGKDAAKEMMNDLLTVFDIIDVNESDCFSAFANPKSNDYEDALAYASAYRNKVDCIITRDNTHFKDNCIKVYSPADFGRVK